MQSELVQVNKKTGEEGFNLIEAAIVLGIVGLIVGGIWAAAASAYENMRQQAASKNLLAFAQNIRGFYSQNPADTVDTDLDNAFKLGLIPQDMVAMSGTTHYARHQWGGNVTLADGGITGVASFKITFSNMGADACRNFISRNANAARGSGLLVVGTASAEALNLVANAEATVNVGAINCGSGALASPYFTFGLRG